MTRILVALATLLVLVLGAAFAVPAFINWADYRDVIDEAASTALGRTVRTSGEINVTLLPEPRLRFGKVTIENASSSAKGPLLTVEGADVAISLHGLFEGKLEAETVKLVRPDLQIDLTAGTAVNIQPVAMSNMIALPASIRNIEIIDGRVSLISNELEEGKPLTATKVAGTLAMQTRDGPYRFAGKFMHGGSGQLYDLQFAAAPAAADSVRISGKIGRGASKSNLQFDGAVLTGSVPVFEGNIATALTTAPSKFTLAPIEIQLKSVARADFKSIALSDLIVTVDAQNRPQILTGSASAVFATEAASLTLSARSFDADQFTATGGKPAEGASVPGDWAAVRQAIEDVLWIYPNSALRLSLGADQIQLRGDSLANVKIEGQRSGSRWVFEQLQAILPGEAALKVLGNVSKPGSASQFTGVVSLEGQNLVRLARWIDPTAADLNRARRGAFAFNGAVTLSESATAFEGVTGSLNGNPFKGSLNFEKTPLRKLSLSLSGETFDLSEFDLAATGGDATSVTSLNAAGQAEVAKFTPVLGRYFGNLDAADLDVTAREVKTSAFNAQNLSARLMLNQDALTVSKLNIETREGLMVRGEGVVPLKGFAQGVLEGRIEARSADAIRQAAALYGIDGSALSDSQAASLAPAEITASYRAKSSASDASLEAKGILGGTRFQGKAALKGSIDDWKRGSLNAQLEATAPDGNKLLAQLSPTGIRATAGQEAATVSLRLSGSMEKLETSLGLKAQALQVKADGVTDLKSGSIAFKGQGAASSTVPEAFLPPALLALLGGEPRANLRIEAALDIRDGRIEADKLKTNGTANSVTGRILLDRSGKLPNLEADLKMDQLSPSAFAGYFLSGPSNGGIRAAVASVGLADASEVWSNQPFSLSAFAGATAKIALTTKSLKFSNDIVVSNAEVQLELDDGRLELKKLEGTTASGEVSATGTLGVEDSLVGLTLKVTASDMDLSMFPGGGKAPLIRGNAAMSLLASGQGLSPRGLVSVLEGRGRIGLSSGQILKLSPPAIQKAADEMLAAQTPMTEDAISKKILEAAQSGDFEYRRFRIPVVIKDGTLEIRRASFRSPRDGTIRLEAYLELASMKLDSTWQIGVRGDRRVRWPPLKLAVAGPLRDLGNLPRTLSAEDFVRGILVRKMERDINRLEGLNTTVPQPPSWSTTTQPQAPRRNDRRDEPVGPILKPQVSGDNTLKPLPRINPQPIPARPGFEVRMRDVLQGQELDPSASSSPARTYGR